MAPENESLDIDDRKVFVLMFWLLCDWNRGHKLELVVKDIHNGVGAVEEVKKTIRESPGLGCVLMCCTERTCP